MSEPNGNSHALAPIYLSAVPPASNGQAHAHNPVPPLAAFLGRDKKNYRASVGQYGHFAFHYGVHEGQFSWYDIPRMRQDPRVKLCFRVIRGPLDSVKWTVKAKSPQVAKEVDDIIKKFWRQDLDKAVRMVEWGSAAGKVNYSYDRDSGAVKFENVQEFSIVDAKPLQIDGKMVGITVSGLGLSSVVSSGPDDPANPSKFFAPQYIWFANDPEFGNFWGKSRYQGAWAPWMEKRGKKGALDSRRLLFFKYAFRGGTMKHPIGSIETENGIVSNADYAREIIEKGETGNVMTMPSINDDKGKPLWEYEPATIISGDSSKFLEYPKALDEEITEGMELPPEVVKAIEAGNGLGNNRSVPFIVFLTGEDAVAKSIIHSVVEHICKPVVAFNHGPDEDFEVEVESLLPKEDPPQPEQPGQPGKPGEPQPGAQPEGQPGGMAALASKQNSPQQVMGGGGLALSYDAAIAAAAADVDTDPTDEQKRAGNYRKGHCTVQGLPITIENPKGSVRRGCSADGKEWSQKMAAHYGYIKRTESDADGDHIDVFLGKCPESEVVFVVDQVRQDGAFDEHKGMIGYTCADEAKEAYLSNYSKGWTGFGGIKALTMPTFKEWIKTGDTGRPIAGQLPASLSSEHSGLSKLLPGFLAPTSEVVRLADLDWIELPDLTVTR